MAETEKEGQTAGNLDFSYAGQYQASGGIGKAIDNLWKANRPDGNDDTVRSAIESFFLILDQDIRNETNLQNRNMPLFDRVEFADLCRLLRKILDEYVNLEVDGELGSTSDDRAKLTNKIVSALFDFKKKLLANIFGDEKNIVGGEIGKQLESDDLKKKILKPLSDFFRDIGQAGTGARAKKRTNQENVNRFVDQLKQLQKDDDSTIKRFESLAKQSNKFKDLKKRIRNIQKSANVGSAQSKISSINKTLSDTSLLNIRDIDSACSQLYRDMRKMQITFDNSILPKIGQFNSPDVDTFSHQRAGSQRRRALFDQIGQISEKTIFPTIVKVVNQYGNFIFEKIVLQRGRITGRLISIIDWCQGMMVKWLNFKNLIKSRFDRFKRNHKVLWASIKRIGLAVQQLKQQLKSFVGWVFGGVKSVIGKSLKMSISFVKATAGTVVSSIGTIVSKVSNTILHPIQTLKRISESGMFRAMLVAFSSPSAANTLGFFCGFAFGLLKKLVLDKVFPDGRIPFGAILKRFVFIPILSAVNTALAVVKGCFKILNGILEFIKDNLFVNVVIKSTIGLIKGGKGGFTIGTWLARIALELFGYRFQNEENGILSASFLATAFSTYAKVKTKPMLNGMWNNGGILGKILGAGFASMMSSPSPFKTGSDDKDGKVETLNIKMVNSVNENEFSEYQTSKNIRQAMFKGGNYKEDVFRKADDTMRNINRERFEIRDSLYQLDDIIKSGEDIPEELVQTMTSTFLSNDNKKMRGLLDYVSTQQFGNKFSDLDERSKVGAMQVFLRARLWSVNNMLSRYNLSGDDPKLMEDTINAADDMLKNLGDFLSTGNNLQKISHGISWGRSGEEVQMNNIVGDQEVEKVVKDITDKTWETHHNSKKFKEFLESKIEKNDESVRGLKTYTDDSYTKKQIDTSKFDHDKLKNIAREFLHSETFTDNMDNAWVEKTVNGQTYFRRLDQIGEDDGFGWKFDKDSFEEPQVTANEYLEHAGNDKAHNEVIQEIKSEKIRKQKERLDESVKNFNENNKDTLVWMKDTMLPLFMQFMENGNGKLPSDMDGDAGGVIK